MLFSRDGFTRLADRVGLPVKQAFYTQGASFWAGSTLAWLAARGLIAVSRERPILEHPLFGVTAAAFAAFDLLRRPFAKTSQMFFVLGEAGGGGHVGHRAAGGLFSGEVRGDAAHGPKRPNWSSGWALPAPTAPTSVLRAPPMSSAGSPASMSGLPAAGV